MGRCLRFTNSPRNMSNLGRPPPTTPYQPLGHNAAAVVNNSLLEVQETESPHVHSGPYPEAHRREQSGKNKTTRVGSRVVCQSDPLVDCLRRGAAAPARYRLGRAIAAFRHELVELSLVL